MIDGKHFMLVQELQDLLVQESGLKVKILKNKLLGRNSRELFRLTEIPGDFRFIFYLMNKYPNSILVLLEPTINFIRSIKTIDENSDNINHDEDSDIFFGKDPEKWNISIKIERYLNGLRPIEIRTRKNFGLLSAGYLMKEHLLIDIDFNFLKKNKDKFKELDEALAFSKTLTKLSQNNSDFESFKDCFHQYVVVFLVFMKTENDIVIEYVHSS